ncbi:Uma2 family endonuclease [uncultured Jatrophihabitans sp.]|uniref:Uma2 family endonuclease n=1 Tax=uncultured Jatrophihabitans sp. TaxID=1610747 RepID=UPI0035CA194A
MSSLTWSGDLLTLEQWDALGDDDAYRWAELVEGVLQMSPTPSVRHQRAMFVVAQQLESALTGHPAVTVCDIDVVLSSSFPPTVRQPDVVVVSATTVAGHPKRLSARDVLLAVEIISPGSRRIDRIMKLADYADAGIPNYWILDLDGPVALDAFALTDGRYEPVAQAATGRIALSSPVPIILDLDALAP